jgi:magnesium chelatase family protein
MTLTMVNSAAVIGLDGKLVEVEVDISNGLPAMTIVGLPETAQVWRWLVMIPA